MPRSSSRKISHEHRRAGHALLPNLEEFQHSSLDVGLWTLDIGLKEHDTNHHQLVRGLGPIAAISINVGNIIGTGIFLKARVMTCNVGTPWRVILVWIVAGLLALAGALTYAELTTMRPHAGAEYVITKDAYGRVWGFLNGWSQFLISRTASAAALAVGFAIFMNDLLGGRIKAVWYTFTMPGFGHEVQLGHFDGNCAHDPRSHDSD